MFSSEDTLFKSATFLTALLKSDIREVYINEGFTPKDMIKEIAALSTKASSTLYPEYEEKIKESINEVLSCLCKEGLVYYINNRYFITEDGEKISDFMTMLSKSFFHKNQEIEKYPYRFYPNSSDIYGLN